MEFSGLEGKRIAVVIEREQGRTVCRGIAHRVVDEDLGQCLRIEIPDDPGRPCFLFPEARGDYEVLPDYEYGCDYAVVL